MRNLLALFGAVLLAFAGLGWYLDWYKIKNDAAPQGHHNVNIDINAVKVEEDVSKGVHQAEEKIQHVLEKDKSPSDDKAKTPAPSPPANVKPAPR
jgi:hypothetical protein